MPLHLVWSRIADSSQEHIFLGTGKCALASIEECSVFSVLYVPLIVVLQRYVWRIKLKEINLGHSTKGESAPTTLAFNQNIEENKFFDIDSAGQLSRVNIDIGIYFELRKTLTLALKFRHCPCLPQKLL